MFDVRTDGSVTFPRPYTPSMDPPKGIKDGDSVRLKIGEVDIIIRNVKTISENRYSGTIQGWEDPNQGREDRDQPRKPLDAPSGLTIGEDVEFTESNVFVCY
jgi:hypothetical protein